MIRYRLHIDVENLRNRLSRSSPTELAVTDVLDWLEQRGIHIHFAERCFVATEDAIDTNLRPWEVLERLPLLILPEAAVHSAQYLH